MSDRASTSPSTTGLDQSAGVEAVGISPPLQTSPTAVGEHNSSNDNTLDVSRQLSADVGSSDPASAEADAQEMLESDDLVQQIVEDVHSLGVVDDENLILMTYLTATARLMPKAIVLCVHGPSSSGKTHVVDKVLDLIPPADVYRVTQLTPKHLCNLPPEKADLYRHKIIFIREKVSGEGDLMFREMAESAEVSSFTVRDNRSQISFARGPITYIYTMTLSPTEIQREDASRMFFFPANDSAEQTAQVMQAKAAHFKEPGASLDCTAIIQKHHEAQATLTEHAAVRIVIPYADLIELPADDPGSRRLQDRILRLLEAMTFLGQFRSDRRREETDGISYLYSDALDWREVLPLVETIVAQKYGVPTRRAEEFIERIRPKGSGSFSIGQLMEFSGLTETTVRNRIKELPTGWVKRIPDGKKHLYIIEAGDGHLESIGLPTYEQVEEYGHGC